MLPIRRKKKVTSLDIREMQIKITDEISWHLLIRMKFRKTDIIEGEWRYEATGTLIEG